MTKKQQLWLTYYKDGQNPTQAAISAGYKGDYAKIGRRNLNEIELSLEFEKTIKADIEKKSVADIREITLFWSELLRSEEVDLKDKLKVSELLAKVQGAFSNTFAEEEANPPAGVEEMPLSDKLALIARMKEGAAFDEF